MIRRGMVHWLKAADGKLRPAVVISIDKRNDLASDIIIVPCSRQLRFGPWHVPLAKGEASLPSPSVVRCEEIQTVHKADVVLRPIGGPLSPERMREIEHALLSAVGISVQPG